jgi:hypothetical protein
VRFFSLLYDGWICCERPHYGRGFAGVTATDMYIVMCTSAMVPEASEIHHCRLGAEATSLQPVGKRIDCRALLGVLWLAFQIVRGSGGKLPFLC